jgi:serine/threonine-protein kinase
MSPEQVRGDDLDPRADLYSAAILFYEMLAGKTPFDTPERDELQIRTAQLEEPPPPLAAELKGLPPELDRIVARALAKDRVHRFASALELGEAVRCALGLAAEPAWAAQQQFAALAKTISEPVPQVDPELLALADRLRTQMTSA